MLYTKSKYIAGIVRNTTRLSALVFPDTVQHNEIAPIFEENSIVSAGFAFIKDDGVLVYGESTSLNIKSNPDHAILVARAIAHPSGIL